MVLLRKKLEHNAYSDKCIYIHMYNYGLGRHMGICLWFVDTYNTDQMLAFESVGRVVSNVECGWSTYHLLSHDIFSEFYRHTINPVYFCACLRAVCTDTSAPWISRYQSMGFLGHFVVQCPIHTLVLLTCQECLQRVQVLLHESIAQGLHLQGWSYLKWLDVLPFRKAEESSIAKFGWMFLGLGKMITYSLKCTQTHPTWSEWFVWEHPVKCALEHARNQTFVVNFDWNLNKGRLLKFSIKRVDMLKI